jgi:hypothetical protein
MHRPHLLSYREDRHGKRSQFSDHQEIMGIEEDTLGDDPRAMRVHLIHISVLSCHLNAFLLSVDGWPLMSI